MRIVMIGDIGGHSEELVSCLRDVGCNESLVLPEDVVVIQVGDLIHRGPDSTGVLDIVEAHIRSKQWIQLIGNHESNEFIPQFEFETVSDSDRERLEFWNECGYLRTAAAVESDAYGDVLITHAGLTSGFYDAYCQGLNARSTAITLDNMPLDDLLGSGYMLGGNPNAYAGPIWAHSGYEVYPSWMGRKAPFHQVHGHTSPYYWNKKTWFTVDTLQNKIDIYPSDKHTVAHVGGKNFWGIDPGLGRYGGIRWSWLEFEGEVL